MVGKGRLSLWLLVALSKTCEDAHRQTDMRKDVREAAEPQTRQGGNDVDLARVSRLLCQGLSVRVLGNKAQSHPHTVIHMYHHK